MRLKACVYHQCITASHRWQLRTQVLSLPVFSACDPSNKAKQPVDCTAHTHSTRHCLFLANIMYKRLHNHKVILPQPAFFLGIIHVHITVLLSCTVEWKWHFGVSGARTCLWKSVTLDCLPNTDRCVTDVSNSRSGSCVVWLSKLYRLTWTEDFKCLFDPWFNYNIKATYNKLPFITAIG